MLLQEFERDFEDHEAEPCARIVNSTRSINNVLISDKGFAHKSRPKSGEIDYLFKDILIFNGFISEPNKDICNIQDDLPKIVCIEKAGERSSKVKPRSRVFKLSIGKIKHDKSVASSKILENLYHK